jgi:hypothetical protein
MKIYVVVLIFVEGRIFSGGCGCNTNKSIKHSAMADKKDDNPDYAGPEGNKLRAEAQKFAEQRGELLGAATKAFESGDKAKAKELSDKGKEAGRQMEEANKKAAAVILKHRNDGHGDNYLDLHGLYLQEALDAFHAKMEHLKSSSGSEEIVFEVIPGAGNHSKDKAIIKPKIIEELSKDKSVRFEEKNAGSILVFIPPSGKSSAAAAPAKKASAKAGDTQDVALEDVEQAPPPSRFVCCVVM